MRQKDLTADQVIADAGLVVANGMAGVIDEDSRAYAQCQQAIRDIAERLARGASTERVEDWLHSVGEPARLKAKHAVYVQKAAVIKDIRPIVDPFLRAKTERQLELLAEVAAIDAEKVRVSGALATMGIHFPSCEIPEISAPLLHMVRARLERALAAPSATRSRPAAEPAYEPATTAQ
jgi:hypothetical protein